MEQHVKKTMVRGKLICWMTTHEGSSQVQDGFQVRGSRQPIAVNVDLVIHLANGQRSSLEVDGDGPSSPQSPGEGELHLRERLRERRGDLTPPPSATAIGAAATASSAFAT